MSFTYAELLNKETFRIFTLEPGQKSHILQGTLQTHLLNSAPEYEALSYVWISSSRDKSMICNGHEFKITDSLDVALRRLRLSDKPRSLWIDQICINQESIDERNVQVGLMGLIYSKAVMVNAWLGPADFDDADAAQKLLTTLANICTYYSEQNHFPEDKDLLEYNLPPRSSIAWSNVNSMLAAPYFSRVWVIQEFAVATKCQLL
jgi:hypothetical protein